MRFFQRYGILFFILALVMVAYFSGVSFNEIFESLIKLKPLQILVLVSGFLFISLITIFGKKLLLYFLGYKVRFINLTLIHFASISAHYATPAKIGFPVTVFLLKKMENVPVTVSTASIFVELFVSMFFTGVVGFVGSAIYFRDEIRSFSYGLIIFLVVFICLGFLIFILYQKSKKVKLFFHELITSLKLLTISKAILYILLHVVLQISLAAYLVLVTYYFKGSLNLWHAMIAHSSAFFIGAISMVPMGLGTRDISLIWYLQSFGVSSSIGISVIAIQRIMMTGLGYLLGLVAAGIIGVHSMTSNKKNRWTC
nr:flippase-like domain-containing protein [Bacteroidota bacterium]